MGALTLEPESRYDLEPHLWGPDGTQASMSKRLDVNAELTINELERLHDSWFSATQVIPERAKKLSTYLSKDDLKVVAKQSLLRYYRMLDRGAEEYSGEGAALEVARKVLVNLVCAEVPMEMNSSDDNKLYQKLRKELDDFVENYPTQMPKTGNRTAVIIFSFFYKFAAAYFQNIHYVARKN